MSAPPWLAYPVVGLVVFLSLSLLCVVAEDGGSFPQGMRKAAVLLLVLAVVLFVAWCAASLIPAGEAQG